MSRILLSPPDVGPLERERLLAAFDSGWIAPAGPELSAFESEVAARTGVRHAVALTSGTAGLHLALVALGVGTGDRVWLPSFTFVATANAVSYTGAQPVFFDSDRTSWCIDPALVEHAFERAERDGTLPAALIAVDIFGQCADYDRLEALCRRFGVPLLEDAAESLGGDYRARPAGQFGDAGVLSFNGNKIITSSGGGMVLSNRDDIAQKVRHLATQAREPVPHYEHKDVGYNYRLSNLLAALGRAQLVGLDGKVAARRSTFSHYSSALHDVPGLDMMPVADHGRPNCWLTCILLDPLVVPTTPAEVCRRLDALGIEARRVWKPMHLQPVYRSAQRCGGKVCEELYERGVCLPSGSSLTAEDVDRVVAALTGALGPA